jgi:hypothetical protein
LGANAFFFLLADAPWDCELQATAMPPKAASRARIESATKTLRLVVELLW